MTLQTPEGAIDTDATIANGMDGSNVNVRFVRAFMTWSGGFRHLCLTVTNQNAIYPQIVVVGCFRRAKTGCGYNPGLLGTARFGIAPRPGVVVGGFESIRAWIGLSSSIQKGRDAA